MCKDDWEYPYDYFPEDWDMDYYDYLDELDDDFWDEFPEEGDWEEEASIMNGG